MRCQDIQEDIILLIEPYLLDPIFTREIMMSKSAAAANLAYWVINDDILMRGGYTGTGVRKATRALTALRTCLAAMEALGPLTKTQGRGFMELNIMNEQTPIVTETEHFVRRTISALVVLLGILFLIIGYAMGAIYPTVENVLEDLLLIGWTPTIKRKQMLTTNRTRMLVTKWSR